MVATLAVKLNPASGQADGTAITQALLGTTFSPGAGNANTFQSADAMGDSIGLRFGQTTANTIAYYLDFSAAAIVSLRWPFKYGATPVLADPGTAILRGYSDGSTHAVTVWTCYLTSGNKLRLVEAGTGGATGVSTASLAPLTEYVCVPLLNTTAGTLTVQAYAWGQITPTASVTITLATPSADVSNSVRLGVGNASSGIGFVSTNDQLAVYTGDVAPRVDLATGTVSPASVQGSAPTTVQAGGLGTGPGTRQWYLTWGDNLGVEVGPSSSGLFTKNLTVPATPTDYTHTLRGVYTQ